MGQAIGRFLLDEDEHGVRLRVRESDTFPLIRWLAVAAYASVFFFPLTPLLVGLCFFPGGLLMATGNLDGIRRGIQWSSYPRVRRLIQVARRSHGGPFRRSDVLTLTLDGKTYAASELVGIVVATSVQTDVIRFAYTTRVVRRFHFAPTLIIGDRAFQLDVFEGADETDAKDMARRVGSALTGDDVNILAVPWKARTWMRTFTMAVTMCTMIVLWPLALANMAAREPRSVIVWAALASILGASLLGTAFTARFHARERTEDAKLLVADAKRALLAQRQAAHAHAELAHGETAETERARAEPRAPIPAKQRSR